jgi:putative ABC transport system permease protein
MKFLGYVLRNALRNPVRSLLTCASVTVSLFLMMVLWSFLEINTESAESLRVNNRLVTMSSQGFAQPVPIARVREIGAMDGVAATTPLLWYGGSYGDEPMPFAQFGVDSDKVFKVMDELTVPPDQLKEFESDRAGVIIGRKLATERKLKIGDPLPLKGDLYPFSLYLTVRGVYDGPSNRDLRMCFFHWTLLDEGLKREYPTRATGNAGIVYIKCKEGVSMPALCKKIDAIYRNSDTPTRTLTDEAFAKLFAEMFGDMKFFVQVVAVVVGFALIFVVTNALAMSMRERVTEIAVLKAIGFHKPLVVGLVLAEAILVAGIGGVLGSLGAKALFATVDISRYSGGFLPFFYVPWSTALYGLAAALTIGLVGGLVPALRAAGLSVIDGLRRVV